MLCGAAGVARNIFYKKQHVIQVILRIDVLDNTFVQEIMYMYKAYWF